MSATNVGKFDLKFQKDTRNEIGNARLAWEKQNKMFKTERMLRKNKPGKTEE
jgi:hypothetical protein